ncbi:MAG TPA: cytochrome c3 family protein, partial [Nitrospirota bacterium]
MLTKFAAAAFMVLIAAGTSWAAGAHEGMECVGCHNIHYAKGPVIFEVAPNTTAMPKPAAGMKTISSLCLGCHADPDKGGMGILPISAHTTHPFGSRVNPKVAKVPDALLRDGIMDCVSCHDPHPSNTNYKYLRVDTKKGAKMQDFCDVCHPAKVDSTVNRGAVKIFNSMDEVKGAYAAPVSDLEG